MIVTVQLSQHASLERSAISKLAASFYTTPWPGSPESQLQLRSSKHHRLPAEIREQMVSNSFLNYFYMTCLVTDQN